MLRAQTKPYLLAFLGILGLRMFWFVACLSRRVTSDVEVLGKNSLFWFGSFLSKGNSSHDDVTDHLPRSISLLSVQDHCIACQYDGYFFVFIEPFSGVVRSV